MKKLKQSFVDFLLANDWSPGENGLSGTYTRFYKNGFYVLLDAYIAKTTEIDEENITVYQSGNPGEHYKEIFRVPYTLTVTWPYIAFFSSPSEGTRDEVLQKEESTVTIESHVLRPDQLMNMAHVPSSEILEEMEEMVRQIKGYESTLIQLRAMDGDLMDIYVLEGRIINVKMYLAKLKDIYLFNSVREKEEKKHH